MVGIHARKCLNHTSPWRMRLQKLRRMQLAGRRLLSWAVSDQFAAPLYASSAPATMLGRGHCRFSLHCKNADKCWLRWYRNRTADGNQRACGSNAKQ
jgi:hypothetical protein